MTPPSSAQESPLRMPSSSEGTPLVTFRSMPNSHHTNGTYPNINIEYLYIVDTNQHIKVPWIDKTINCYNLPKTVIIPLQIL